MPVWNLVANTFMKTYESMLIAMENPVHFLRSANWYGATPHLQNDANVFSKHSRGKELGRISGQHSH